MADVVTSPAVEPISLYFELQKGFTADLEVVSRAALAWSAAIKEAAYMIDPSLEVRVEVTDATASSFSFNSMLRDLGFTKEGEKITLRAVVWLIVGWMSIQGATYTFERVADALTGHDSDRFTAEQQREIREIVTKALAGKVAQPQIQLVFREAERDPAIKGIGVSRQHGTRPDYVVPRSEFRERSGRAPAGAVETINRRVTTEEVRVTLISPVLVPGLRKWRFRSAQGEFGASIKDERFLERVLAGTTSVRMRAGIELEVELETTEDFKNGLWTPTDRNILRVDGLTEPPTQGDLFASGYNDEPDDDGN